MVTNNIQFQENVSTTIQDLQIEIGQLATMVNQLCRSYRYFRSYSSANSIAIHGAAIVALVITTNKLQVEQKEKLLQDLKKLRDFYEHPIMHSTLRFLLKKSPEDVILEVTHKKGRLNCIGVIFESLSQKQRIYNNIKLLSKGTVQKGEISKNDKATSDATTAFVLCPNKQDNSTPFTQDCASDQPEILLMTIAKHLFIAILRIYTTATSSVGKD
ncbi:hypothetical protein CR513_59151, partial [Mucuna pruriens]